MDNNENFRKFLVKWMADNWNKRQSAFAEFLGISRSRLSNIVTGHKGTSEEARIAICNKLSVDYRSIIQIDSGEKNVSNTSDKICDITPQKPIDLRIAVLQANVLEIYKSGDSTKISVLETCIASLRLMIQMEKRARKKGALSLKEGDESLLKPHAPRKLRG